MGREALYCQSAVAAPQTSPPAHRPCSEPSCWAQRNNSRFGVNLFAAEGERAGKGSQDFRGEQSPVPTRRGDDDNRTCLKPSVLRARARAPAQWVRAGGCWLVVVVTGEAAFGSGLEPGWGRRREVGAERSLSPPARPERWEDETGNGLRPRPTPRREGRPRIRAGAGPCTSLSLSGNSCWLPGALGWIAAAAAPRVFSVGSIWGPPWDGLSHGWTESLIPVARGHSSGQCPQPSDRPVCSCPVRSLGQVGIPSSLGDLVSFVWI